MMRRMFLLLLLVHIWSNHRRANAIDHPEEMVNLLAGSFTDGDRFSTGNTLPLVGRPWGFNHWSPQSKEGHIHTGSWWFKGSDHQLTWLRCTHQPSPWIGDWGWFLFTPMLGGITRNPVHFWEPRAAVLKPHLLDATVAPFGIRMELTPTDHGAMLRVTFPPGAQYSNTEKDVCFAMAHWEKHGPVDEGGSSGQYLTGRATQVGHERMMISNFNLHLRAESAEAVAVKSSDDMRCFSFKNDAHVVVVRIATSLISAEQTLLNLKRELKPQKSFDTVALESKMVWNKLMRRVNIIDAGDMSESTSKHLNVFYTGLYRALTFPRRLDEIDAQGQVVHYSPYDPHGRVHQGPLVTDNGFWDTFRTVYPMLSLIYPDHLGNIIQGWLNAYKEGGWLPSWASPGYRNCMVGTFADVVVADAIVKNVPNFDLILAKEALHRDSFDDPPNYAGGAVGKLNLNEYKQRGFLGSNVPESVSRTLDYGFADFSTAQAFIVLSDHPLVAGDSNPGEKAELRRQAEELLVRSERAYSSLFDKSMGLMLQKRDGGNGNRGHPQYARHGGRVSGLFNPIEWGNGYTEGNAWHHSFPPYAVTDYAGCAAPSVKFKENKRKASELVSFGQHTLSSLFGSKENALRKLHELLDASSNFRPGSYGQEIHEMTEMRALAMGQYGHNNQPCHHILYLFALLGQPETTQQTVRTVMERAYGRDFYAGDEDNGEQGAWFVLSALGLYSVTPGTPDYVLGSPVFRHVRIDRSHNQPYDTYYDISFEEMQAINAAKKNTNEQNDGDAYLDIIALGTGPDSVLVDRVELNGKQVTGPTVDDRLLQSDGVLRFVMRNEQKINEAEVQRDIKIMHEKRSFSSVIDELHHDPVAGDGLYFSIPHFRHMEEELAADTAEIQQLKKKLEAQHLKSEEAVVHKNSKTSNHLHGDGGYSLLIEHALPSQRHSFGAEYDRADHSSGLAMNWSTAMLFVALSALGCLKLLECCCGASSEPSTGNSQSQNSFSLNDFNSPRPVATSSRQQNFFQTVSLYFGGIRRHCTLFLRWLHISYTGEHGSHTSAAKFRNAMREAKSNAPSHRYSTEYAAPGSTFNSSSGGLSEIPQHDTTSSSATVVTSTSTNNMTSTRYPAGRKKAAHVV